MASKKMNIKAEVNVLDKLSVENSSEKNGTIQSSSLTNNQTYDMPDKSGTIALVEDIPTVPTSLSQLSGTLSVNKGGTGTTSLQEDRVVLGGGTGALKVDSGLRFSTDNGIDYLRIGSKDGGDGRLFLGKGENHGTIYINSLTDTRSYNLPDKSGTVALVGDITASNLSGTVPVSKGGTGVTTYVASKILFANTTTSISQNTGLGVAAASGKITYNNTEYNAPDRTQLIVGSSSANYSKRGLITMYDGSNTSYGNITVRPDIGLTAVRSWYLPDKSGTIALLSDIPTIPSIPTSLFDLSGILSVAKGGTGHTTFTVNKILFGNGTSDISQNSGIGVGTATATDTLPERAQLILGNPSDKKRGAVVFYDGSNSYYGSLISTTNKLTANRTWYLPDNSGTIALVGDIPTTASITNIANTQVTNIIDANLTQIWVNLTLESGANTIGANTAKQFTGTINWSTASNTNGTKLSGNYSYLGILGVEYYSITSSSSSGHPGYLNTYSTGVSLSGSTYTFSVGTRNIHTSTTNSFGIRLRLLVRKH